jgi:thiosulfate/3-mercaptopyruvate sulfurtransferase
MGRSLCELPAPAGPLVGADWLQENLDDPRVRVLDVRGRHPSSALPHAKHAEYAAGHIPGAVFVDWEHDFVDPDDPVPVQIAATDAFVTRAGELGVSDQDLIVTYDDYYGIFAARVAWAFRYHGAESRVLDGGWTTWQDEGRPTSIEAVTPDRRQFVARPRPKLRRALADVQELVDGATGLWAGPAAVKRLVRDAGIDPDRPPRELIATCGSGVSATVVLFSLERIGIHVDGVYDGSFNEWSAAHAPVEYGPARNATAA